VYVVTAGAPVAGVSGRGLPQRTTGPARPFAQSSLAPGPKGRQIRGNSFEQLVGAELSVLPSVWSMPAGVPERRHLVPGRRRVAAPGCDAPFLPETSSSTLSRGVRRVQRGLDPGSHEPAAHRLPARQSVPGGLRKRRQKQAEADLTAHAEIGYSQHTDRGIRTGGGWRGGPAGDCVPAAGTRAWDTGRESRRFVVRAADR
jgi:hypothetical protein